MVKGKIVWISGPVVKVEGMAGAKMYETVYVGYNRLIGEIIRLVGDIAFVQVYESTSGLRPNEPVEGTGQPLSVLLGPGMMGRIYDGVQRPLDAIAEKAGAYITRGISIESLDFEKKWHFRPVVKKGNGIGPGDVIGVVQETPLVEHRVMVPPDAKGGRVVELVDEGDYTIDEVVAVVEKAGAKEEFKMYHRWPVRKPRPALDRYESDVPLITGQRVIDTLFPVAKGGTASIPGGFGTGKCVPSGTPVLLQDGRLLPIERLFSMAKSIRKLPDGAELGELEVPVISFDGSKLVKGKATHVYKGKTERLVLIRTSTGREVKVTPAHRLFTLYSGGLVEKEACRIREGEYLLMPGGLPINGEYQSIRFRMALGGREVNVPIRLDRRLAELLGMLVARGEVDEDEIRLFGDEETIERFSELSKLLFGVKVRKDLGFGVLYSKELAESISNLISKPGVPEFVLKSPNSVVSSFLRGYYLASGSFDGAVKLPADSKWLATGIAYLLSRVGILYSIEGDRLTIVIREPEGISEFLNRVLGGIRTSKVDEISGIVPSGAMPQALSINSSLQIEVEGIIEVYLDRVEEVKVLEDEQEVYDLTVPKLHNFVGGFNPSLLHNTVMLHQVAKWADTRVVFYIGCGERGNEMTEVLVEFPKLKDPHSGRPLMERTILVANVSNMPVTAREASIYTGVTMAEYYRDMGYDVVLVADSTSRWAEALREISGRMEEMPAEEGYPSYLASRLAEFYERAGRMSLLGRPKRQGSVTLIGAVSPSGADFTEPVTTHTLRFIRTFWALDTKLAYSRHYPAINWMLSYSGYLNHVKKWWVERVGGDWPELREELYQILRREDMLKEIVRLLGPEALPDEEKLVLDVARMIKIGFLQQSAYDEVDSYCSPEKQYRLLRLFVKFYGEALEALRRGVRIEEIRKLPLIPEFMRAKNSIGNEELQKLEVLEKRLDSAFRTLTGKEVARVA